MYFNTINDLVIFDIAVLLFIIALYVTLTKYKVAISNMPSKLSEPIKGLIFAVIIVSLAINVFTLANML